MGKLQYLVNNHTTRIKFQTDKIAPKAKLLKTIFYTVCIYFTALLMVSPVFWMISTSFKKASDIFVFPFELIPKAGTLDNYIEVWFGSYPFGIYYMNSIIVTIFSVAGALLFGSLSGYAFARLQFVGRDKIFLAFLATLMIPTQVTLIPKFMLFRYIDFLDKFEALILPAMFQVICVFFMRQFFMQIPKEYNEAAKIDGANEFETFFRVILPMAKPALMTLAILVFTWSWNDYENPLIFMRSENHYTLPLGLNHFVEEFGMRFGPMMAASFSSVFLILVIFIFGQRYFIEGLSSGGIKG